MNTWSERSTFLADSLIERINNYVASHGIPFEAKNSMSGFNDRIVVTPTTELGDYEFISIIIGWAYADAEMAIVHWFNNDTEHEHVTGKYLTFDNSQYEIDEDRIGDGLKNGTIKYYPSPFDEQEENIFNDVKTFFARSASESTESARAEGGFNP